ncbi:sigma factor-like helix-turn-helix DNA-binding protein [Flavisphingomonas formosensis]|uniref:sigma factor-like helix-turn-helix DNA-binding protein n=1 Tax=Flavisphingomonas formosensis TaxID=861534 RepID=UPI0012FB5E5C|nr:sigma factor-like helix-turn-helix DNA-binding protein [Sphingomonas formosensis]
MPGPPAVALARARWCSDATIFVCPLETEFTLGPDAAFVRAWIALPRETMPEDLWKRIAAAARALEATDALTRRIFFLSASYGLPTREISVLLGMNRRAVRRRLRTAIACLDRSRDAGAPLT